MAPITFSLRTKAVVNPVTIGLCRLAYRTKLSKLILPIGRTIKKIYPNYCISGLGNATLYSLFFRLKKSTHEDYCLADSPIFIFSGLDYARGAYLLYKAFDREGGIIPLSRISAGYDIIFSNFIQAIYASKPSKTPKIKKMLPLMTFPHQTAKTFAELFPNRPADRLST